MCSQSITIKSGVRSVTRHQWCRFTSLLTGEQRQVNVLNKFVDATFNKDVPSAHQPQFAVSPEARCVPLNELPRVKHPHSAYGRVAGFM